MQFSAATITICKSTLVAILVDPDQTYPAPGARLIAEAQRYPTLAIILL